MSHTEPAAVHVIGISHASLSALDRELRSDHRSSTVGGAKSEWPRLNHPHGEQHTEENHSAHDTNNPIVGDGDDRQSQNAHLLAFKPYIYEEDSAAILEPLYRASPIPARYGGRSTPVAHRYESEMSSNEDRSYLTETDGLARSHHTVQSYVAVNPFTASIAQSLVNIGVHSNTTSVRPPGYSRPPTPILQSDPATTGYHASTTTLNYIFAFCFDTIPRQIYLHLQLRLPSLYFSRVARIFEDAELSMPEIKRMALAATNDWKKDSTNIVHKNWNFEPSVISPPFSGLKTSWEGFIDSLLREWQTLNIVSVLLLS
jgi:hypothetical protein